MAAANFNAVLTRILQHEGGWTNDPHDPGGATMWGITIYDARLYWKKNATPSDVKAMPIEVAKRIYKEKYWDALRCDDLPSGVDDSVADYGVNSGIGRAGRVLRQLAGVAGSDWHITDAVLAAVNKRDPRQLVLAINQERLKFLRGLSTWWRFGKGWSTRVAEVQTFSLQLVGNAAANKVVPGSIQTPVPQVKGPVPAKGQVGQPPQTDKPVVGIGLVAAAGGAALHVGAGIPTWAVALAVAAVIGLAVWGAYLVRQSHQTAQTKPVSGTKPIPEVKL